LSAIAEFLVIFYYRNTFGLLRPKGLPKEKALRIVGVRFLKAGSPSCHPINSVNTTKDYYYYYYNNFETGTVLQSSNTFNALILSVRLQEWPVEIPLQ